MGGNRVGGKTNAKEFEEKSLDENVGTQAPAK